MDSLRRGMHDIRHARRDKELQKYARKNRNAVPAAILTPDAHGVVGAIHAAGCVVHIGEERRLCRPFPGAAVGDEAAVAGSVIVSLGRRRTVLSRPDPGGGREERVLAANVDLGIVVASAASPPFRPGLVDRIVVAIERGGVEPLLCLNKADLGTADLSDWEAAGIATMRVSATTGEGMDELRRAVQGRTCVLTGHSGVGKSSLVNALCPLLQVRTSDVGRKGRHTTTASCLHDGPGGSRIIDTPGIREFGLYKVSPAELRLYFPEFAAYARLCRFRDCTHTHEPDCAVRLAAPARYRRYLRLLGTLEQPGSVSP